MGNTSEISNFYGRNIIEDAGDVVTTYDGSFGKDFRFAQPVMYLSPHQAAASIFLGRFIFSRLDSDENNVARLRNEFSIWQASERKKGKSRNELENLLTQAAVKLSLSDLADVAEFRLRSLEEQDYWSRDSDIIPPGEIVLQGYRNMRRITLLAARPER